MDEKVYCTYIVASRSHTLYIGVTGDLLKCVFQHKQKAYEGFSAKYNCNRLVWFERFAGPTGAIAREKQLKGWIRAKKIALIEKMNPAWGDLSEGWYVIDPIVNKGGSHCARVEQYNRETRGDSRSKTTAGPSTAQGAKSAPCFAQDDNALVN